MEQQSERLWREGNGLVQARERQALFVQRELGKAIDHSMILPPLGPQSAQMIAIRESGNPDPAVSA
jgi:hypothetical protein